MHQTETINGVEVRVGFLPVPRALVNSEGGPAIVLGSAPGWLDELDAAMSETGHYAPIFGVNGQRHYQGCSGMLDHWVTIHGSLFSKGSGYPMRHTVQPYAGSPNADVRWPLIRTAAEGSSALTATLIALMMGFDLVMLAGVHLNGEYTNFRAGWAGRYELLRGRVLSVSPVGTFLRDLFGGFDEQ